MAFPEISSEPKELTEEELQRIRETRIPASEFVAKHFRGQEREVLGEELFEKAYGGLKVTKHETKRRYRHGV